MVLPSLTNQELETRERLRAHVHMLAGEIGGRSALRPGSMERACAYIESELHRSGYHPERQHFFVDGIEFFNIETELAGSDDLALIVGAHYDTAGGLPGANDNATGVAACLELARTMAHERFRHPVRWVFFANEEPPYFQSAGMGSRVYAERVHRRGEKIAGMISVETIGYYSDQPGSQRYPFGFHPGYPDTGDFLGFVSNLRSAGLLRSALRGFRGATSLPAVGAALPASIAGVGWSDHWSFWQFGYAAIMLTDTAPFRYPYYHSAQDTPEKLDYDRLARAVVGIGGTVRAIAGRFL